MLLIIELGTLLRCGEVEGLSLLPHAGAACSEDCRCQWGVSRRHGDYHAQVFSSVGFNNHEVAGLDALWRRRRQDKAPVAALKLYLQYVSRLGN
jgi:hypothetical protein